MAKVVGAWRRTDQTRAGGAARRDQPLSNLSNLIDDRARGARSGIRRAGSSLTGERFLIVILTFVILRGSE